MNKTPHFQRLRFKPVHFTRGCRQRVINSPVFFDVVLTPNNTSARRGVKNEGVRVALGSARDVRGIKSTCPRA
eukprot:3314459-Lingulodinium_polyedra.AAC.1